MILLLAAAASACDSKMLLGAVKDAEQAFATMDGLGFDAATFEVNRLLACQTDAVTPVESAAYHRVRALAAFLSEDMPATILSFQAALAAMPGYELPPTVAPDGHPLREQFEQAGRMVATGGSIDLPPPQAGWVTVDGMRTRIAPAARPFVFQRLDVAGAVVDTDYVEPGDPLPTYASEAPAPLPAPGSGRKLQAGWVAAGGALGLVAGGLYGGAFATRSSYEQAVEDGERARILSTHRATNTLVVASLGALGAGTGLVLVGVF